MKTCILFLSNIFLLIENQTFKKPVMCFLSGSYLLFTCCLPSFLFLLFLPLSSSISIYFPLHYSVSSFPCSLVSFFSILPSLFASSSSLLAIFSFIRLSLYLQVHPFLSCVTVILSAESNLFPSRFSDTTNLSWYFGA